MDPNGDLFSACPSRPSTAGGAGDVVLGAGAGRGRAARGKRADEREGREEWFERPGPVDLPGYLKEEEEVQRRRRARSGEGEGCERRIGREGGEVVGR